jgi:hypothetical protein
MNGVFFTLPKNTTKQLKVRDWELAPMLKLASEEKNMLNA